jgi:hypothetical protein
MGNTYHIIYDGLKDYVKKTVPVHQQTGKFSEFLEIYFDRVQSEIYNLQKNIWTLLDPMEIDPEYLGYLSKFYDMGDITDISTETLRNREFVRDLPYLLKRKGTNSSIYDIWKVITQTNNYINIYEKWHSSSITGTVPTSAVTEYNYVNRPEYDYDVTLRTDGAGEDWYKDGSYPSSFESTTDVQSTGYRIELDMCKEPITNTAILPKDIWDRLYEYWEFIKPINRVSEYSIVLAPICDFTGGDVSLYDVPSKTAYCISRQNIYNLWENGAHIEIVNIPSTEWTITHDLSRANVVTAAYNFDFELIFPDKIEYIDSDTVIAIWPEPTTGYFFTRIVDYYQERRTPTTDIWKFKHLQAHNAGGELIIQFRLPNEIPEEKVMINDLQLIDITPDDETALVDTNYYVDTPIPVETDALIKASDAIVFQTTPSDTWEVLHNLHYKGVIASCYDNDGRQMVPDKIELISEVVMRIHWPEPVTGYTSVVAIGNIDFYDVLLEILEDEQLSPIWRINSVENGLIAQLSEYDDEGVIPRDTIYEDDNYYYLSFPLPKENEYTIRELGILNQNQELLFYTKCSELYKPENIDMTIHYRIKK